MGLALTLALGLSLTARAQFDLIARVTPTGSLFHYDISVANPGPEDLLVVTFLDAPTFDPFIGSTLTAPGGFQTSYDGPLGFVDFLADTEVFGAGSLLAGFSFDSLGGPQTFFQQVEGLSALGTTTAGRVTVQVVPETSTVLAAGALGLILAGSVWQRRRHVARVATPYATPPPA
ncbi:MAG: hypothetical protein IT580_13670 [Verrucomicrobiales bacterium]|nr:hypothetical protein [Verrucomicrobiales bacterium]